jgi:hypothetical protein
MRYTIEQLNKFREEAGFSRVANLSQRAINQQCREWVEQANAGRVKADGDMTSYHDHDDYNRHG